MSLNNTENLNNIDNKESPSLNNSKSLNKSAKDIYDIPVTIAMSSLLGELSEKQKQFKKMIEEQRTKIKEAEKKFYHLSYKMFPSIESRYNKINLTKKKLILEPDNERIHKYGKKFKKSKSEIRINNNKYLSKNLFQTSLNNRAYKPLRINISKITTPKITSFNNQIITNKKNMILDLSTTSNKNNVETSKINYNYSTNHINKGRIKKYKVDVIKRWEFKNGFNTNNIKDKSLVEDSVYQKNLICNNIEIIIDSTNFFKLKNANILEKFVKNNDINNELLIQLNKLIEETSGLYIEIGHLIINEYESFINGQNKTRQLNPPEMKDGIEIINERNEFSKNLNVLNECIKFLTVTYNVYLTLNHNSEYILPLKKMIRTRHFLNRARSNINYLNIISKQYIETAEYEKNVVDLYNSQKKVIENGQKLRNRQYFNLEKLNKDDFENFREKGNNEYGVDKFSRLRNLLNGSKTKNDYSLTKKRRPINCKYIDFSDKMFNKLFKYINPDLKESFEGFSVTQKKNNDKNKFERKVYKFNF